jgi:hypothetical protein
MTLKEPAEELPLSLTAMSSSSNIPSLFRCERDRHLRGADGRRRAKCQPIMEERGRIGPAPFFSSRTLIAHDPNFAEKIPSCVGDEKWDDR